MMIEVKRVGRPPVPSRWIQPAKMRTLRMTANELDTLKTAWRHAAEIERITFNDWILGNSLAAAKQTREIYSESPNALRT